MTSEGSSSSSEQAGASCPCSWLLDADSEYLATRGGCWGVQAQAASLWGEEQWGSSLEALALGSPAMNGGFGCARIKVYPLKQPHPPRFIRRSRNC